MKDYKLPFLLVFLLFNFTINQAYSQDNLIPKGWGIGLSAGLINTNLASGGEFFFEDINPFLLKQNSNLSFRLNVQYDFSPYESIRTDISTGKFSLTTNYAGWPDLTFANDFITSSVSAQLSLMRYLGVPPQPLNIYGLFGIGINFNNLTAVPANIDSGIESQKTNTTNAVYTFGGGLRLYISSNVNLYTEYNLFLSAKQVFDSNFIRDNLNTDFTSTSSRWRGLQTGIQIKFHRKSVPYVRNNFQSQRLPSPPETRETPASPSFTEFFETINVEEPSLDSLDSVNDVLNELSRENIHRFDSHSEMTFTVTNVEPDVISEFVPDTENDNSTEYIEQTLSDDDLALSTLPTLDSEYGTTGEWNKNILTGYTIVIHSLTNLSMANTTADELRQNGFRTLVIPTMVNNINFYHVAIGQYSTKNRAIYAANHLPSPLRDQYFLFSLNKLESHHISEFNTESDANLVTGITSETVNDEDILLSTIPSFVSEYGTTGEWNIDDLTGYTIVLHSLTNLGHANRVADELRESGYRVLVIPAIVNNTNYYRVAIGQYETRHRAIQAANHLPSPIKSQYFIMSLP
jgi:septal ring-binding cell division protein DamX/opacity protein-like surface antigen